MRRCSASWSTSRPCGATARPNGASRWRWTRSGARITRAARSSPRATGRAAFGRSSISCPASAAPAVSLSFMRRDHGTPNGLMEFVIVRAVELLRERGVEEVSLNFAAFARWLERPHGRLEHALGRAVSLFDPLLPDREPAPLQCEVRATLGAEVPRVRAAARPSACRSRRPQDRGAAAQAPAVRVEAEHRGDGEAVGLGARRCRDAGGVTRRWAGVLFAVLGLGLLPWALWLGYSLPSRQVAHHWDLAWVRVRRRPRRCVARDGVRAAHRQARAGELRRCDRRAARSRTPGSNRHRGRPRTSAGSRSRSPWSARSRSRSCAFGWPVQAPRG